MKAIWQYFKQYHLNLKHPFWLYCWITVFLGLLTWFNYTIKLEKWLDRLKPEIVDYVGHFVMFTVIYWFIIWLCVQYKVVDNVFKNKRFVLKSFFMLAVLTIDVCFAFHQDFIRANFDYHDRFYLYKTLGQLTSILTVLLPLFIYYKFKEKHDDSFYGLKASARSISQYIPLVLLMIPLIAVASFHESFRNFYPIFKENRLFMEWSLPLRATVFELVYGWDFLTTEFLFRGFMVLGFTYYLGPRAVLPMVGLYVALHFGKPAGETIGSFFGGYILGVLAYQSKNIWGGILAHIGVAWLMELFAWLQKNYN